MSWLADQVAAAAKEMNELFDTSPRLRRFERDQLPADLGTLAEMLADAAILQWMSDGNKVCPHVAGAGPQPTFIFLYDPSEARCMVCAMLRDLQARGTDESFTCDCCGVVSREVQYYPLGIVKAYVTVHGGICEMCHDRVVGER